MSASVPSEVGKFYSHRRVLSPSEVFSVHRWYRHRNMQDACFQVNSVWESASWDFRLNVSWWHKNGYPLGVTENITVKDPENYQECMPTPVDHMVKDVNLTHGEKISCSICSGNTEHKLDCPNGGTSRLMSS